MFRYEKFLAGTHVTIDHPCDANMYVIDMFIKSFGSGMYSKARFTICHVGPWRRAAKIEMDSILAAWQRGTARRGNATKYREPSLRMLTELQNSFLAMHPVLLCI